MVYKIKSYWVLIILCSVCFNFVIFFFNVFICVCKLFGLLVVVIGLCCVMFLLLDIFSLGLCVLNCLIVLIVLVIDILKGVFVCKMFMDGVFFFLCIWRYKMWSCCRLVLFIIWKWFKVMNSSSVVCLCS